MHDFAKYKHQVLWFSFYDWIFSFWTWTALIIFSLRLPWFTFIKQFWICGFTVSMKVKKTVITLFIQVYLLHLPSFSTVTLYTSISCIISQVFCVLFFFFNSQTSKLFFGLQRPIYWYHPMKKKFFVFFPTLLFNFLYLLFLLFVCSLIYILEHLYTTWVKVDRIVEHYN